jgi:[acyl-carrier-protein] S-malonyltransferase
MNNQDTGETPVLRQEKAMPSKTIILCPGQGAQVVGMGKDYFDASPPVAREVYETANRVLGSDLGALCFNGPEERLNQTDISQPAIFVTSVASFKAACQASRFDSSPMVYAGLSLGEYTALHLAGVFSFEDGLKLVAARGRYMQEAAVASPSGMVAIMGADEAAVNKLCQESAGGEVMVPANFNAPGQIVVSGSKGACERVLKGAEAAGFKATALKVAGAFHSPLMQPAADRMKAELDRVTFSPAKAPVYANVTAELHGDVASIKKLLVQQIVAPVRWEQIMMKLIASDDRAVVGGVAEAGSSGDDDARKGNRFVELAPGRTLAGLAKRISRRLPIESLATADMVFGEKIS